MGTPRGSAGNHSNIYTSLPPGLQNPLKFSTPANPEARSKTYKSQALHALSAQFPDASPRKATPMTNPELFLKTFISCHNNKLDHKFNSPESCASLA